MASSRFVLALFVPTINMLPSLQYNGLESIQGTCYKMHDSFFPKISSFSLITFPGENGSV